MQNIRELRVSIVLIGQVKIQDGHRQTHIKNLDRAAAMGQVGNPLDKPCLILTVLSLNSDGALQFSRVSKLFWLLLMLVNEMVSELIQSTPFIGELQPMPLGSKDNDIAAMLVPLTIEVSEILL